MFGVSLRSVPAQLKADKRFRYLAAGGLNTFFGYAVANALYYWLSPRAHILVIGFLAGVIAISFSFLTYKTLVFRTKGHWLREYLRCYVVYGFSSIYGLAAVWALVDGLGAPFWAAQAGTTLTATVISYLGHSRYSFARPLKPPDGAEEN